MQATASGGWRTSCPAVQCVALAQCGQPGEGQKVVPCQPEGVPRQLPRHPISSWQSPALSSVSLSTLAISCSTSVLTRLAILPSHGTHSCMAFCMCACLLPHPTTTTRQVISARQVISLTLVCTDCTLPAQPLLTLDPHASAAFFRLANRPRAWHVNKPAN